MTPRLCQHCHKKPVNRPRGLCWTCYYSEARTIYGPMGDGKYTRRGEGVGGFGREIPERTTSRPGTEEKVAILERRMANGMQLWNPEDGPEHEDDDLDVPAHLLTNNSQYSAERRSVVKLPSKDRRYLTDHR